MKMPRKIILLIALSSFAGCRPASQETDDTLPSTPPSRLAFKANLDAARESANAAKSLASSAGAKTPIAAQHSISVTPTKEVDAAARKMLAQAAKAKTLTEVAPCLTNESAARIGKKWLFMMSMTLLGVAHSESPLTYYDLAAKKDFEPIIAKYKFNVSDPPQKQALVAKYLDLHGRELLLDIDPVLRKGLERERPGDPRNGLTGKQTFSLPPDKYTIYQVSPTVLYITTNGKAGLNGQHFEAHFEDGAWRLHMTATRRRLVNGKLIIVPGTSGLDNAFSTLPRILPAPGHGASAPSLSQGHSTD